MFSTLRKLILLVLGIPFVILGTRFLLDAGSTYLTYRAADGWTPTNALVTAVEHYSGQDQALGNQTVVRYEYEFGGQTLTGQYSCIGDECPKQDLHQELETTRRESRPVTALVDPQNPAQSMLFRHLYMPMFLLKTGVGLFCFLTGSAAVIFGVYLLTGQDVIRSKRA